MSGEWQQNVLRLLSNLKTRDAIYLVMQFSLRVILAVRGIVAANPRSAGIFSRIMTSMGTSPVDAKLQSAVSALATGRKVLAFGNIASELPNFLRIARGLFLSFHHITNHHRRRACAQCVCVCMQDWIRAISRTKRLCFL